MAQIFRVKPKHWIIVAFQIVVSIFILFFQEAEFDKPLVIVALSISILATTYLGLLELEVSSTALIKRLKIGKFRKEQTINFEDVDHFDIEKNLRGFPIALMIQLKSGKIKSIKNIDAFEVIEKNMIEFGLKKKIVNRHKRDHLKVHE